MGAILNTATQPSTSEEAVAFLTSQDPRFAVIEQEIRGVTYRVFQNVPNGVAGLLETGRKSRATEHEPYLFFEGERWSYGAFCEDVYRQADALQRRFGVGPGTRVALCSQNCPEMLMAILAIASLGGIVVFLNSWWETPELEHALKDSKARIVLADGKRCAKLAPLTGSLDLSLVCQRDAAPDGTLSFAELVKGASPLICPDADIDPDSDFAFMYTSGSSGTPKGVVLTHRGAVSAAWSGLLIDETNALLAPPAPDALPLSLLMITPLFHVTATHPCFFWSLVAGSRLTVMPKWDAEQAVRLIRDENITRMIGVPTQSADLMDAAVRMGETLPSLTSLNSGGAKRPAAQARQLAQAFPQSKIGSGYGLTETNALGMLGGGPTYLERPDSTGKLIPPLQEAVFLGEDGTPVAPGEVGELCLKSPAVMRCYLNRPDATADVLQDGWFKTGDLARIDEDGFIYIVDRKKDIIIRGGENISCLEVDGALYRHPLVAEAAVFPMPDDRLGEIVGAAVVLKPDATVKGEDLRAFLKNEIAYFKIPERIWMFDAPLPRTASAKIDRRAIRAMCLGSDMS